MALAPYLWLFPNWEKKDFQAKLGFGTQDNMFGVSFQQWKAPAPSMEKGALGYGGSTSS